VTTQNKPNYFMSDLRSNIALPSFRHDIITDRPGDGHKHVLWVDGDDMPGGFYSEYLWHFPGNIMAAGTGGGKSPDPHIHSFDEVIGFVGINQDDHFDLGGEVEIAIGNERFASTKSFLVLIPAGTVHCPIEIKKIDTPIFQFVLGATGNYSGSVSNGASSFSRADLERYFVFDYKKNLIHPEYRGKTPEVPGVHYHILYLDGEVVPGSNFYVEASWFGTKPRPKFEPGKEPPGPKPHTHPFAEIITFFGTDPDDVHDLGGELELWIEGEKHIIAKSFVAYIPPNVEHCPIILRNVTRPIFHFTAGPGSMYI
jgi:hypothetical protein